MASKGRFVAAAALIATGQCLSLSAGAAKVPYFEGTPIPTSVLLVALLAVAAFQGRIGDELWFGAWELGPWILHPLSLLYALSGSLMISKTLHIPKI